MTQPLTIPPEVVEAHRAELAAWVQANGIAPCDIAMGHPLHLYPGDGHGVIVYQAFTRDAHGHKQLSPDRTDVLTDTRTAPCLVPLPPLALLPHPKG
ncbi:hypothetical protein OG393_30980 [Streptomyces sp. NBC_01216]|uniref:hypothetical protein n=1 Tax=Streptomyces sp. NBC_01216 TaxID=2903778 RepID=UPI002E1101B1|nr:hypothetical protein OG393_30980 [Streptomyces sp. NBC_01216]